MTSDTQRDISGLLNTAADRYGFDPVGFLGGAIAESNLREDAERIRDWPDVSFGLWQPAVKWLGPEAVWLTRAADGTVLDTPKNRQEARNLCWDAAWLTDYVAPRYAALLLKWGTPLEAWCRWNKPNIAGADNPNRANYERGLAAAREYAMTAMVGEGIAKQMKDAGDEPITNEWTEIIGEAKVVKAWGRLGLYVASDDSGGWVNVGPFGAAES